MREFFEILVGYPFTSFCLGLLLIIIVDSIKELVIGLRKK